MPEGGTGVSRGQKPALRSLASELRADARSTKLPAAVSTGLVLAVLLVVFGPTQAATIFAGPLDPFVAQGTGMILFGCFAMCLTTALTGSYKGTVSMPNFAPAIALLAIGSAVAAQLSSASDEAVFATMVAIVALTTLITAVIFLLIGRFRLANLFRFMPYPIVGGFLAGLGGVLTVSSISIASGLALEWETLPELLDPDTIPKWGSSVVYAAVLLLISKVRPHYLVLPASVVLAVGLCHAVLLILGISTEDARAAGILFVGMPVGTSWPPIELAGLAHVNWNAVASQIPGILGVTLITLICIVLNAGAVELGSGAELDMNREFQADGAACLVASLGASSPGCNSSPMTLINHATGAETRLTGIVVALAVGSVLFFGGDLLAFLPMPLLGGLALFVGLGLLIDWLVATSKTLPRSDYGMILLVALVICFFGFVEGVVLGLVAAVIFFVVRYSAVDVVNASFTIREYWSKRVLSAIHRVILQVQGDRVRVYRLRGYIIFGNASPLGDRLKEALKADPTPIGLLLDFTDVSGFDISAANIICRSIRAANAQGTNVVLSAMTARSRSTLRPGFSENEWQNLIFEEDFDRGLERCEDMVIAAWERLNSESEDARDALFDMFVDHSLRELNRQARFEALAERLEAWVQPCTYAAGETIVAGGEIQKGMQFLTEGRAVVHAAEAGERMRECGPGDVLAPQAAFGACLAERSVVAQGPCRTVLIASSARQALEREDAALTVELDRYLIEAILDYRPRPLPGTGGRF
ncbi:MAG: SulP family inorganic anion transporter [Rhodospirillaceae bacterium]|nr:SulP family inorganic anion transporter [Rhodospirillaceae bacterium]